MKGVWASMRARLLDGEGAGLVEYSILVMVIAVVALIAVTTFGESVSSNFDNSATHLANLGG